MVIGDLARATTGWIEENRTLATIIGGVVVGGILAATIGIGVMTALIVAGMIPALIGMAIAGWAAVAPLLPFIAIGLAVIVVIGVITAAIIWMVRNWERVTEFFDRHWPRIASIIGIILPPIGLIIAAIGLLLRDNWGAITGFFASTWGAITGFFQAGSDFIARQVNRVLGFARMIADIIHRITGGLIDLRGSIREDIPIEGDDDDPPPAGARPRPPGGGAGTVVEGDTIINQDIRITQLEGESQDQFDRRLNKTAVSQIDAVAGAR